MDEEGEERKVKIGTGGSRWADAEKALRGCVRFTALDSDESVLRVLDIEDGKADVGAASPPSSEALIIREIPGAIVAISQAIGSAADQACARQAEAFQASFTALIGIVNAQGALYAQAMTQVSELQSELHETLRAIRDNMPDNSQQNTDSLALTVLGQALGGGGMPQPGMPVPNGHTPPRPPRQPPPNGQG